MILLFIMYIKLLFHFEVVNYLQFKLIEGQKTYLKRAVAKIIFLKIHFLTCLSIHIPFKISFYIEAIILLESELKKKLQLRCIIGKYCEQSMIGKNGPNAPNYKRSNIIYK